MDPNSPTELAKQIADGGHGGLSPAALAEYKHSQERIAEMFETAALSLRRQALEHAVTVCGSHADPAIVTDAARKFEAFLKGESDVERA
jgi:hypothetical protein